LTPESRFRGVRHRKIVTRMNWITFLDRRHFLRSSLAAATTGISAPAFAHALGEPYVLPEEQMPTIVRLSDNFPAGEIHINPSRFSLYLTLPRRKAVRYIVGIGRGNLYHSGEFYVGAKREWPTWIPTPDMMEREPDRYENFQEGEIFEKGQPGGIRNPLGARALYLFNKSGHDTYLRIHGTNNPRTIGIAVSNGCARLVNDQITELYENVPLNTRVVLYPKPGGGPAHAPIAG